MFLFPNTDPDPTLFQTRIRIQPFSKQRRSGSNPFPNNDGPDPTFFQTRIQPFSKQGSGFNPFPKTDPDLTFFQTLIQIQPYSKHGSESNLFPTINPQPWLAPSGPGCQSPALRLALVIVIIGLSITT